MASFGQKLKTFMTDKKIKATELAGFLHVDPTLISKWTKGVRNVEQDSLILPELTYYLSQKIREPQPVIDEHLGQIRTAIKDWLYDGSDIMEPDLSFLRKGGGGDDPPPVQQGYGYLGMDGVRVSLGFLMEQVQRQKDAPETNVYISSEYSMLLTDPKAEPVWDYLYEMNGMRPVRVIFEQWKDKDRTEQITKCLMPFLHAGKMELLYLISSERYLCYNAMFYADGAGMVMTTEPAGGAGNCVSLFLDNKSFVHPMGAVLDKLAKNAVPMLRVWDSVKNRGAMDSRFYDEILYRPGDLDAVHHGMHLAYLSVDAYERLLKKNEIPAAQIRFRKKKFAEQKVKMDQLLQGNRCREIYRFDVLDRMLQSNVIETTDLFYANRNCLRADREIVEDLLHGMVDMLQKYGNLQMMLVRDELEEYADVSWRVKEDKFLLMHTRTDSMKSVSSDNWLLCRQYMRNFEELWGSTYQAVHGKKNVIDALTLRLQKLGRMKDEV
ncbi:helix-turn-helix domain-containing protein [Christensenellaceae bacterium OttesenSCG-928-K19]|nr:helix-turn-helix domain-containing protein [Christensenellaceae bacterium OttesenSCG-928-K19]